MIDNELKIKLICFAIQHSSFNKTFYLSFIRLRALSLTQALLHHIGLIDKKRIMKTII